jgi:putative ABC transport system substrate-binding protein
MLRRKFITLVASAAAGWPLAARAQQTQMRRIGALILGNADAEAFRKEMREGLSKAGYVEGRDVSFDIRSAQGRLELLPKLAAELVAAKVDVLVALYTPCARAAQLATRNIPIVAIVANPDHASRDSFFGTSGELTHAVDPSCGIGVKQLVMQRVRG